ncbi:MAG: NAD-dependent epimerase/dehydratase family protein [Hyphomicrobium sp.]|nr:NAD-dependent epimerase/dehydratase family protein [Hyphomicrobium sp.]MBN9267634.1 NAD-dependent epimerase/dehydratase family protein [Hyphomicrobium sp.]MBN9278986.1 NAD-dependent epimerase/dehydratase family protein [Hyphomicrobium sp.]
MAEKQPTAFVGSGRAVRQTTYGYVEDVGHAIVLASSHPAAVGQSYNIGYPDYPTERNGLRR